MRISMSLEYLKATILFGNKYILFGNNKRNEEREEEETALINHMKEFPKMYTEKGIVNMTEYLKDTQSGINTVDFIPVKLDNGEFKASPIVSFEDFRNNFGEVAEDKNYNTRQIIQIYKKTTLSSGEHEKLPYVGRIIGYSKVYGLVVVYKHLFPGDRYDFEYDDKKHRMRTTYVKNLFHDNFRFQVVYPYD
jgi:hypothetical protein